MDNIKNDSYYIQKIQQDLEFIVKHMKNVDIEELNANEILLDSMLFRMIQISENSRKLTEEYKQKRRMIPWNAMYGMRNRIVHDYGNVDLLISTRVSGLKFYGLVEEIRAALHKKVDVLNMEQLMDNPELTKEILKDGIKIYG